MSQTKQACASLVLTALLSFAAGAAQTAADKVGQQKHAAATQAAANAPSSPGQAILGQSASRAKALLAIDVDAAPAMTKIVMGLSGDPAYDAYLSSDGKTLVVDLYDTIAVHELETVLVSSGNEFSDLNASVVSVDPQFITRVAVPLPSAHHFSLGMSAKGLEVELTPSAPGADPALQITQFLSRQWEHQLRSPRIAEAYLLESEERSTAGLLALKQNCTESVDVASGFLRSVRKDILALQLADASTANQARLTADLTLHEPVIRKAMHSMNTLLSEYEVGGRQLMADLALYRNSIVKRQKSQRDAMADLLARGTDGVNALQAFASTEYDATKRDQAYFDSLLKARDTNAAILSERLQSLTIALATSREAVERLHAESVTLSAKAPVSADERLDRFDAALAVRSEGTTPETPSVAHRLDEFSTAMAQVAERETSINTQPLTHAAALVAPSAGESAPAPPSARNALTQTTTQRGVTSTVGTPATVRMLRSSQEEMAFAEQEGIIVIAQSQNTVSDVSSEQSIRIPKALSLKASSNLVNEGLSAAEDPLRQAVNVNFKNMPLDNVVSLLANKGQISVISEVDLAGGVTAQLSDISLGRAIEVILRNENLGIVEEDGIYRITDYEKAVAARRDTRMITLENANATEVKATLMEVVASSPDFPYISISANATTNMLIVQGPRTAIRELEGMVAKLDVADAVLPTRTEIIPLNYSDPAAVQAILMTSGVFSTNGKASPDARTRMLIVTDLPQNIEAILKLIPALDLPVKQVSIQAMIVDAIMNDDAETGFQWFLDAVQKGSPPIVGGHLESFGAGFDEPLSTAGSLAFSVLSGDINLDGIIRAEVLSNNAELLANPVLITTENNPATINLTSEFPYQEKTSTDAGGQIAATQFKEIGTILNVTPKVTHDNDIGIQIDVKQSAVTGFTTTEVPIEAKRQIVTNLRLNDGETIFIGGLRQHDDRLTVKKVPVLGDIPVLNILFRTNSVKEENIELLVFLTCNVMPDDPPELTPYQKEKFDKLGGTPELPDGTRAVLRPYVHPEEQRNPIWKPVEE